MPTRKAEKKKHNIHYTIGAARERGGVTDGVTVTTTFVSESGSGIEIDHLISVVFWTAAPASPPAMPLSSILHRLRDFLACCFPRLAKEGGRNQEEGNSNAQSTVAAGTADAAAAAAAAAATGGGTSEERPLIQSEEEENFHGHFLKFRARWETLAEVVLLLEGRTSQESVRCFLSRSEYADGTGFAWTANKGKKKKKKSGKKTNGKGKFHALEGENAGGGGGGKYQNGCWCVCSASAN